MVVCVKELKKNYGRFQLSCSLNVEEGCITGLVGQNGAGKTTLFKSLMGLIHADGGSIEVLGTLPEEFKASDKQKLGVVLSDSSFNIYLTVREIARIMNSMYMEFDTDYFLDMCERFGLPENKEIKTFSTGMMAKLKVLSAVSHKAQLLILDEPTAGLDVVARDEILEILREYMEIADRAILISSHISSDLEGLCDDIYMIHQGKIVLHEETDTLISNYGLLKVDESQYQKLDKKYLLKVKKESFGYSCLTNEKQFYLENYPDIVVEKGSIDEAIMMTIKGESL